MLLYYTSCPFRSYGMDRALLDGFYMSFLTQLNREGEARLGQLLRKTLLGGGPATAKAALEAMSRAPPQPPGAGHVLFDTFWVERGPLDPPKGGEGDDGAGRTFVLTPSVREHQRNLARAVVLRKYPILLQASPDWQVL